MAVDRKRIYHKRDRLRQLRAFCCAARYSSITQAAEMLGVSQPSVSLHVRELENELDTPLFDRSGQGVGLTRAGKRLYGLAEPLVRGMDHLPSTLLDGTDDTIPDRLHVAASVAGAAYVLPAYVRRLRELYPDIRLQVRNCLLRDGMKLLLDDEVECVFGVKDPYPEDSLEYRQILAYDIVLITARNHPLAGRDTVTPREASEWPAIVPAAGTYSRQFGETAARQFGVDIKSVIQAPGWGVIKRYVEAGLGISIVPSLCVKETDRLSVIPLRDYFPTRSYGVFTRRARYLTSSVRQLLRLMIPDFPDPLPIPGRLDRRI